MVMPQPFFKTSELDCLIETLDVITVSLVECHVCSESRLSFPAIDMPCIYYSLTGRGQMIMGNGSPISLSPHKLVIAPSRQPFLVDTSMCRSLERTRRITGRNFTYNDPSERGQKFVAGDGEPELVLIRGYFRTSQAVPTDLFSTLISPIVEQFTHADKLEHYWASVMEELAAEQVGRKAMVTAIVKQALIVVLRRLLSSSEGQWRYFALLNDPPIARAFAGMAAKPGAIHTLCSLSHSAGLSRSVFMARFSRIFGCSPMTALRQMRMRQAANLLSRNALSIEQVARAVGYDSRSSFFRAFRAAYGINPSHYIRNEAGQLFGPGSVSRSGGCAAREWGAAMEEAAR
jgi:AraC-like DNA-binding protein